MRSMRLRRPCPLEIRSAGDVARELETTNRYAEKLIHNCLKRVREIYLNITNVSAR